uniref:Uncharacterized protein n=1 Tax=Romanomermis culicivorax TaxID=13658 RepID=A0A915JGK6_ROMCU
VKTFPVQALQCRFRQSSRLPNLQSFDSLFLNKPDDIVLASFFPEFCVGYRLVLDMMTNSISQLSTSLQNAYTMIAFGLLIIPNVDIALELWILRISAFVITVYHLHYVTCTDLIVDNQQQSMILSGRKLLLKDLSSLVKSSVTVCRCHLIDS